MSRIPNPPPPAAARLPPSSCDAHFHVFGLAEQYPVAPDALYQPPLAGLDSYLALAVPAGVERFVLVQPSAYGTDNSCLLDALRRLGPQSARGVVILDDERPGSYEPAELDEWHELGVRGIRLQTHASAAPETIRSWERRVLDAAEFAAARGWHVDFLTPGWLTVALMPTFRQLSVPFSLAHLGLLSPARPVEQAAFEELLQLTSSGARQCWVKLTGLYRISQEAGYADVRENYERLVATAPDRLLWGTDYPHVHVKDPIAEQEAFDILDSWVADGDLRKQILVDNPKQLYDF